MKLFMIEQVIIPTEIFSYLRKMKIEYMSQGNHSFVIQLKLRLVRIKVVHLVSNGSVGFFSRKKLIDM